LKYYKELLLKNRIDEVSQLLSLLEQIGEDFSISPAIIFDITLSLDELLTNIISYGYDDDSEHQIQIKISISDTNFLFEITDDGKEFNPLEKPDPDLTKDLEDMQIGGLGIYLIKNKIDEISYQRINEHNVLTLNKKI